MSKIKTFQDKYFGASVFIQILGAISLLVIIFQGILFLTGLKLVDPDKYIARSEILEKNILLKIAINETYVLETKGNNLNQDSAKITGWLQRVIIFAHYLNLEKEVTCSFDPYKGQKMSTLENELRWIQEDSILTRQLFRTLGVLEGFKSALNSRKESQ